MRAYLLTAAGMFATLWIAPPARAQEVTKERVDGIVNFHRLQTTVTCSGAIKPEALPNIKKMGFVSVINLREPTEPGANVLEEGAAAKLRACDTTPSPSTPIRLIPPRRTSFSTQSPRKVLSRHSSAARAADAPQRCGSSSVWPWIIGTLTEL